MDNKSTTPTFSFRIVDGIRVEGVDEQHALIVVDRASKPQLQICVRASLLFKPSDCLRLLADAGFNETYNDKQLRDEFEAARERKITEDVRVAIRNGWLENEYIHRGTVISAKRSPKARIAQNLMPPTAAVNRKADKRLIDYLNTAAYKSDFIAIATMAAFTGPILRLLNSNEGVILYIFGQPRTGKTSLLALINALSHAFGNRDLLPFNFTERALEEKLYAGNDGILCIDEIGTSPPELVNKQIGEIIYKITNGRGRARSSASSVKSEFPNLTWRVIAVISGEPDLATLSNRKQGSGQDARFLELKVSDRAHGGIFGSSSNENPVANGQDEIRKLNKRAKRYSGDEMATWIRYLVQNRKKVRKAIQDRVREYTDRLVQGDHDSLIQSAAEKFAWLAACGETLIEARIFSWRRGFAVEVIERLYRSYRSANADNEPAPEVRTLARALLARIGARHIRRRGRKSTKNAFIAREKGRDWIYIAKESVAEAFGADCERVVATLAGVENLLQRRTNSPYYQSRKKGEQGSYLKLNQNILRRLAFDAGLVPRSPTRKPGG